MMMRNAFALAVTLVLPTELAGYALHHAHAAGQTQAAQQYELARGAGETRAECVGQIRIGPGITVMDLETTRTDSDDARISLRGTRDSVVCEAILHPAMQPVLGRSVVQFHNGTTVPLAQVLRQILEAGKQPRMPQTMRSTALDKIHVHTLHAVAVYEGTAVHPTSHPIETPQGIIHLTVESTRKPVTLFLMSYYPVDWRVSAAPGARIGSVILRGYYRQTIRGLDNTVPINLASAEDDRWEEMFPRTLVTSRDGLLDFKAYVRSMVGVEPATVQSIYTGNSMVIDGKTTLEFPAPIEAPITQPVVFKSDHESSARFRGRKMMSPDRLTVGYGMSGASTESIATVPHSKGRWYAEFIIHAGAANAVPDSWTNVGIRSTANESGGLTSHDGQLAYGVKRYLRNVGGLRDNDVIGLAMDLTRGHLYVRHNGVWVGGSPDSGHAILQIVTDRQYVVAVEVGSPGGDYTKTDTWTGNFGSTPFRHLIPQGFEPYGGVRPK
ncbi:MAG: hypothetical protein GDA66_09365 [Nitrospira sp. CR1.2]|nr:hypothetical protein [Nitrospira sp. CR1.2]